MPNQSLRTVTDIFECYRQESGSVFMNGQQALARIIIEQMRIDRSMGLNTASFISGYRGSPLGNIDRTLHQAKEFFDPLNIHFKPAINEDLAATLVWGSQQSHLSPNANTDGVVGMWYGKGPGVDRCGDVFKHANAAGTNPNGGVLCVAGDDHGAKSSSMPHQSDHAFMSALIPVLYPSSIHEYIWLGLAGLAMSRYSGCWIGFKVISETVETTATVKLDQKNAQFHIPEDIILPDDGLNLRWPDDRWQQDKRMQEFKVYAALAFARANKLDRVTLRSPNPRFGIVASGKAYEDTRLALLELGLTKPRAANLGISVYKVSMPWPLEPEGVRKFSAHMQEIMIIEERREMIENQIKQHLFNWGHERPRITGKFDDKDQPVLSLSQELNVVDIAIALAHRLLKLELDEDNHQHLIQQIQRLEKNQKVSQQLITPSERIPYYCAGCPHNSSTKVLDGSRASAGIGCHFMVTWMNRNTETFSHMGGEGVPWLACSQFTDEPHQFTNLGDGTYFHSGSLAIRQAMASNANITYKILYNEAVAMTGGQQVDGDLSVPRLTRQLHAEGVTGIYLLSDDPKQYKKSALAPVTYVGHRDEMEQTMLKLRQQKGVSVIIYHQACATEKRRQRRRGILPNAEQRVWIHPEICEGCGDCSTQSNCIAIEPLDTPQGRKRQINQSMCNSDLTCLKGFCPAMISVYGALPKKSEAANIPQISLPRPVIVSTFEQPWNIAVTGVGGMGVVTIGALLGMAAHVDNKAFMTLDFSGLAQKGGAVVSHIRIGQHPEQVTTARIIQGRANLLMAADAVVTSSPDILSLCSASTRTVLSSHLIPTAGFVQNPNFDFHHQECLDIIQKHIGPTASTMDFHELAVKYLGDNIYANLIIMGFALQQGHLPVSLDALEQAIHLNGINIEDNLQALYLGRYLAHVGLPAEQNETINVDALVSYTDRLAIEYDRLTTYQNQKLADNFKQTMSRWQTMIVSTLGDVQSQPMLQTIAQQYSRLLRQKDEYEVARILTQTRWQEYMADQFTPIKQFNFNFSPLGLAKFNQWLQQPDKYAIGRWVLSVMPLLSGWKRFRGTVLDPFSYFQERRQERAFIGYFEEQVDLICQELNNNNIDMGLQAFNSFTLIKGFGHIRQKNMQKVRLKLADILLAMKHSRLGYPAELSSDLIE